MIVAMSKYPLVAALCLLATIPAYGQKDVLIEGLNAHADDYFSVAHKIWEWAEVGYQEEQSSQLLTETLDPRTGSGRCP